MKEEKEIIAIGYNTTEEGIIIEGYCERGDFNIGVARKNLTKYNDIIEIDVTDLTPEEVITKYSEAINNKQIYTSIYTTGSGSGARISTITTNYPLKHMLSLLLIPGNHLVMYGGFINIEINVSAYDYYYGDKDVITSSEVVSL